MMDPYVIIKLITGEEIIGEVTNQNDYSITIMNPFVVKLRVGAVNGNMVEQTTATPYCSYAEDRMFTFELKHTLFVKELKNKVISSYLNMVHEINMREMFQDDVNEYLDALEQMLGTKEEEPTEETYENEIRFLEGNDTIH